MLFKWYSDKVECRRGHLDMKCFSATGNVILGPLANEMGPPNGDTAPKGNDMRAPGRGNLRNRKDSVTALGESRGVCVCGGGGGR